jgi:hypothetical protein
VSRVEETVLAAENLPDVYYFSILHRVKIIFSDTDCLSSVQ